MYEVFTFPIIHKCGMKCSLILLYGLIGLCALDLVIIETGSTVKPELWQSL